MNSNKTRAAVISNGILIGFTSTSMKNGASCCYGYDLTDNGNLIKSGTGKISRAKNWMSQDIAIDPELYVNNGGGGAQ